MQKIFILIGLPGSGKTTFARNLVSKDPFRTIRISMDDILQMTSFYKFIRENVPLYHEFESSMYITAITKGFSVVVDRTNIDRATRERFLMPPLKAREIASLIIKSYNQEKMSLFADPDDKIFERIFTMIPKNDELTVRIVEGFQKVYISSLTPSLYQEKQNFLNTLKTVSQLEIIGVHFDIPIEVCIKRRIEDPAIETRGEGIDWAAVIKKLAEKFEPPGVQEGFDRIEVIGPD